MKIRLFIALIAVLFISTVGHAQFVGQMKQIGPPGSTQDEKNKDIDTTFSGTTREPYSLKRYFNSLAGKDSMNIARMWGGSILLPGSAQLYNKQYWKIPVLYGTVGAFMYAGYRNNIQWLDTRESKYSSNRNLFYMGAALTYWASILDGVSNYKYPNKVLPARASLYSAMLPGLGQIYNGDYWKLPIVYGGLITTGYFISSNNSQFQRYKMMYYETSNPDSPLYQKYNPETMKYYKDSYRRFRDYSVLAGIAVYVLNIIDANVFAHLQDFDISEDLSATFVPGVVMPLNPNFTANTNPAIGFRLSLNF